MKVKINKKKISIITILVLVVFLTGNAFAALVGAPNIFFAIKNLVSQEEVKGEENLLSDRDITISYSPIEIKKGVQLQINRILIEEEKTTLFINLENENNEEEKIGFNVYDLLENGNINDVLGEEKLILQANETEDFEIALDKKVSETEKLQLELIVDEKVVGRKITIDLATKEILVEGKEEVNKISEKELKEYLGCFALLNGEQKNNSSDPVYVAKVLNDKVLKNEVTDSGRELTNAILSSFVSNSIRTESEYTSISEISKITTYGLCLAINDITYNDGTYSVDFTYCFPTKGNEDENIEELQQYQTTIKLELNEDSEYSKYKVISLTEGVELDNSEKNSVDNKKNDDENVKDDVVVKEENASVKLEGRYVAENKNEVEPIVYIFNENKVKCTLGDVLKGTYEVKNNKVIMNFFERSDIYEEETKKLEEALIVELKIINENKLQNNKGLMFFKEDVTNDEISVNNNENIVLFEGIEIAVKTGVQELSDMKITDEAKTKYNTKYYNYEKGKSEGEANGKFGKETYEGYSVVENVKKIAMTAEYEAIPREYKEIKELPDQLRDMADYTEVKIHEIDLDGDGKEEHIVCYKLDYEAGAIGDGVPVADSGIILYDENYKKIDDLVTIKDGFWANRKTDDNKVFITLDFVEYIDLDNDGKMEIVIKIPRYSGSAVNILKYADNKLQGTTNLKPSLIP